MIVAGGSDDGGNYYDTTETLTVGEPDWKITGSLPHRLYAGKMMPSNNVVYYIGSKPHYIYLNINHIRGAGGEYRDGFYYDYSTSEMILEWLPEREVWRECSRMRERRFNQAVSAVSLSSGLLQHCTPDSSERSESNRESILDFINEKTFKKKPTLRNMHRKYKKEPYVFDNSL